MLKTFVLPLNYTLDIVNSFTISLAKRGNGGPLISYTGFEPVSDMCKISDTTTNLITFKLLGNPI